MRDQPSTPMADAIRNFFQWLYEEGIDLTAIDLIYDIARTNQQDIEPRAFVVWYKSTFGEDEND